MSSEENIAGDGCFHISPDSLVPFAPQEAEPQREWPWTEYVKDFSVQQLFGKLSVNLPCLDSAKIKKDPFYMNDAVRGGGDGDGDGGTLDEWDQLVLRNNIKHIVQQMKVTSEKTISTMRKYQAALSKEGQAKRSLGEIISSHPDFAARRRQWIKDSSEVGSLRVELASANVVVDNLRKHWQELHAILGEESTIAKWKRLAASKNKEDLKRLVQEVSGSTQQQLRNVFQVWTIADFAKFQAGEKRTFVNIMRLGKWQTSPWFRRYLLADIKRGSNFDFFRFQLQNFLDPMHKNFWGWQFPGDEKEQEFLELLERKLINSPNNLSGEETNPRLLALLLYYKPSPPDPSSVDFDPSEEGTETVEDEDTEAGGAEVGDAARGDAVGGDDCSEATG